MSAIADTTIHDVRAIQRQAWACQVLADATTTLQCASSDAGLRSYWRSQGLHTSRIVMDWPTGPREIHAWLAMREVLERNQVRVPHVLECDVEAGLLLLEDLGELTLTQHLERAPAQTDVWMHAAIHQLLKLQAIVPPAGIGQFDQALLQRDANLFEQWFVRHHLGLALDIKQTQALRSVQSQLMNNALGQARVLVHRDFMPRNLMPVQPGPAVLDFQDCVIGPVAYDAASLFKDAFVSWPLPRVDAWLAKYHQHARQAGVPVPRATRTFLRDADWMGIQRHLKILGIFARLHYRDGKPQYLADAPRFITYLDQILPRYRQLDGLRRLIDTHIRPAMQARGPA